MLKVMIHDELVTSNNIFCQQLARIQQAGGLENLQDQSATDMVAAGFHSWAGPSKPGFHWAERSDGNDVMAALTKTEWYKKPDFASLKA